MRCRKCGQKAAINMPQHRLALCKPHYLDWFVEQTERAIHKLAMFSRDDRVLVAVSGGKDSLALWDALWRLDYRADGLYIGLGIDGGIGYSDESHRHCEAFAAERGLKLLCVDVAGEYRETIPEMAARATRGQGKPCAVCGLAKRHIMNRVARDGGYTVLATGHNLDDEAAQLFGNVMHWNSEMIRRQTPVLAAKDGLARKVKPLYRFYERETAAYALMRGIAYIYAECPFAAGNPALEAKEWLNRLEAEKPGSKLHFFSGFLQAREEGLFAPPAQVEMEINRCPKCGQPTTRTGLCAFCQMTQ